MDEWQDGVPGGYPDAAVVTSGEEQMILFPSYARRHMKKKEERPKRPTLEGEPEDSQGDFMKQQWEEYKEDNAVVDVDVRGWVFSPHKGQMTRRQRVFISLARQLAGLPAPAQPSPMNSAGNSRDASPHTAHRQRVQERTQRHEDEEAAREAEELVRRGESEAAAAQKGEYTEGTSHQPSKPSTPAPTIDPLERRAAWNQPSNMTPEELQSANAHLMARLAPFMSNPLADTPISAFFYNESVSRQRTIYTSGYGHFALRASLDFVPTHVRILASENLSATEEVTLTPAKGVSLISDVDDTIKHSAISSGAREIFRNAFIRDLADLNIDGVTDWYASLHKKGVKFHYVSNSPWQLYPVLHKYFEMTGLPPGSFHLKQYSGMLQGIFEPVAERKKGTLDRIAGDFPERRFILVGDSGEADLEVYLDFVSENPGRVLAIFIRDVTTPTKGGFFDSSFGGGTRQSNASTAAGAGRSSNGAQAQAQVFDEDEDPELKAAIAASLKTLEEEEMRNRPSLPPRRPTDPAPETEDLIDLSDEPPAQQTPPMAQRSMSNFAVPPMSANGVAKKAPPPVVKKKPASLQGKSASPASTPAPSTPADEPSASSKKVPPPPPARRSTATSTSSSTPTNAGPPPPPLSSKPQFTRQNSNTPSIAPSFTSTTSTNTQAMGYREAARQKLSNAYNALPAAPWNSGYVHTELNRNTSYSGGSEGSVGQAPRRTGTGLSNYGPSAAARGVSNALVTYNDPGRLSGPEQSVAGRPYSSVAGGGDPGGQYRNTGQGQNAGQAVNKRLELWAQRWTRAQEYCRERGVVLRSWRVGKDVRGECEKIVERALREDGVDEGRDGR